MRKYTFAVYAQMLSFLDVSGIAMQHFTIVFLARFQYNVDQKATFNSDADVGSKFYAMFGFYKS